MRCIILASGDTFTKVANRQLNLSILKKSNRQIIMCVKAARGVKYSVIPQCLFIKPNSVVPYGMSKGEDEYGGKTGLHKRLICLWNTCMNFKNQYPRKQTKTERREI